MKYDSVQSLSDEEFKRSTGVQRSTFTKMLEVVEHGSRNFGRPPKLSRADQLLLTLMYWREYRTEFHIGLAYGISEATVCRTIQKIENALIKSEQFHLPGRKGLQPSGMKLEIIFVDVTEQPVERPEKKQRQHYSGKKKCHTQKAQVLVEKTTGMILSATFCAGKKHDFQLFKESGLSLLLLADAGYQGAAKIHRNSQTPAKKTKLHPLNKEQKADNLTLARKRILIEHIFRRLKVFRILSERYRNRRKRFSLRFSLIAAVHNMELTIAGR